MKKSLSLAVSMLFVIAVVAAPLMAQHPAIGQRSLRSRQLSSRLSRTAVRRTAFFPSQMKAAYGFNRIGNQGQGQIIGIVDAFDDPNIESDLGVYDTTFHLPDCTTQNGCFTKIKVGNPVGNTGWGLEISLDVEQAHSLAPAAKIILVEANTNSFDDLIAAVDVAVANGATQVSMSWSGGDIPANWRKTSTSRCPALHSWPPPVMAGMESDIRRPLPTWLRSAARPWLCRPRFRCRILSPPITVWRRRGAEAAAASAASSLGSPIRTGSSRVAAAPATVACRIFPRTRIREPACPSMTPSASPSGSRLAAPASLRLTGAQCLRLSIPAVRLPAKAHSRVPSPDLYSFYNTTGYNDFHDITSGTNGSCGANCTAVAGYDLVTGIGSPKVDKLVPAFIAIEP